MLKTDKDSKVLIADAKQIKLTKKTELSLIKCEKAMVYKNWI